VPALSAATRSVPFGNRSGSGWPFLVLGLPSIYQYLSNSINIYQYLSISINICQCSIKFYQYLSNSINICQYLSNSINIYQILSISIKFHQIPSNSINICQYLSNSIKFYQYLSAICSYINISSLSTVKYNRHQPNSTDLGWAHGIPWPPRHGRDLAWPSFLPHAPCGSSAGHGMDLRVPAVLLGRLFFLRLEAPIFHTETCDST
jgi:hypothetical protein